jgi:hypothetical protein
MTDFPEAGEPSGNPTKSLHLGQDLSTGGKNIMTGKEATNILLGEAINLLQESLDHITEKPWDDDTRLHERISKYLGLPVAYPDWDKDQEEK